MPVGGDRCIPNSRSPVRRCARDVLPVWGETHPVNHTVVSQEICQLNPRPCIPDPDRLIKRPGNNSSTVGGKCRGAQVVVMSRQDPQLLTSLGAEDVRQT